MWRHDARHRAHRDSRGHREEPYPSRCARDRLNRPPTRTAAACARSAIPGLPTADRFLTASTGAQRPRCASPPALGPQPTWQALIIAGSTKSHRLDREMAALGPTTNLSATTSRLPQQRRSAGCFSCPLRTGRTIPFRGKFIGSSRQSSGLQSQAPVGLTSHGAQHHGHRRTRDDWCAGSEPEWQNHEIRMDLSRIDPRSRRPGSRAPASLRMHSLGRFLARRGRVTSIRRSSFSTQSCEVYFRREQEQLTEERIHEVPLPACSGSAAVRHRTSRCRVPRRAGTRHPPRRGRPRSATGDEGVVEKAPRSRPARYRSTASIGPLFDKRD